MGLEQSYEVPPPCTTATCIPPQAANVVYERAYDQYGRPIVVVHQQPPLRTQMGYATTATQVHNPPMQSMYPGYMHTYQPPSPYPVHSTNPYATVSTAQYPGQYVSHPSPGALLTTPGYYYMPASTVNAPTATNVPAPTTTTAVQVRSDSAPTSVPAVFTPSYATPLSSTAATHDALPVLAPLVPNTDQYHVSNTNQQHVSPNLPASQVTSDHVTIPRVDANTSVPSSVTLPGLTPLVSNTDQQHTSNTDPQQMSNTDPQQMSNTDSQQMSNTDPQQMSNTNLESSAESKNDALTSVDPEPLVSFSNVTVINNSPLPGIETKFSSDSETKNSSASTVPQTDTKTVDSPARVKKSFNPLPRRQPAVKAYLAHEEL